MEASELLGKGRGVLVYLIKQQDGPDLACKVHDTSRSHSFGLELAALEAIKLSHHPALPLLVDHNKDDMLLFTKPVVQTLGGYFFGIVQGLSGGFIFSKC
jgi:hypothetical protein